MDYWMEPGDVRLSFWQCWSAWTHVSALLLKSSHKEECPSSLFQCFGVLTANKFSQNKLKLVPAHCAESSLCHQPTFHSKMTADLQDLVSARHLGLRMGEGIYSISAGNSSVGAPWEHFWCSR